MRGKVFREPEVRLTLEKKRQDARQIGYSPAIRNPLQIASCSSGEIVSVPLAEKYGCRSGGISGK